MRPLRKTNNCGPDGVKSGGSGDTCHRQDFTSPEVADAKSDSRRVATLKEILFWLIVYWALAASWWLLASFLWRGLAPAGLLVPDAISWYQAFDGDSTGWAGSMAFPSGRSARFFFGIYQIHPWLIVGINAIAVGAALVLTLVAAAKVAGISGIRLLGAAFALNPLMWIIAIGPSKETFSFFAVSAVLVFAVRPAMWSGALAACAAVLLSLVRLEQAVLLLIGLPIILLVKAVPRPRAVVLSFCGLAVAGAIQLFSIGRLLVGERLGAISPQLEWPLYRVQVPHTSLGFIGLELGGMGWISPQWNALAFLYRLAANPAGCLLRMGVLTSEGGISPLGAGFAVTGFLVCAGLVAALIRMCRSADLEAAILMVPLSLLWIGASAVPFTQPRYLFPMLPIALVVLFGLNRSFRNRLLLVLLAVGLVGRLLLALAGHGIPPETPPAGSRPSFLIAVAQGADLDERSAHVVGSELRRSPAE